MIVSLHTWSDNDRESLIVLCNAVDRTFLSDRLPYPYTEADADWWLGMVAENEGKEGAWRATFLTTSPTRKALKWWRISIQNDQTLSAHNLSILLSPSY